MFAAQKNWPEAEAALQKAIELDPGLAPAYDLLVAIYLETGRLAEADKATHGVSNAIAPRTSPP